MLNPYSGCTFFEFFGVFLGRLFSGKLSFASLAADEVQVLVLLFVSASSSLVGSFLVLRKQTMLANALSHTILLGIVGAYLLFSSFTLPLLITAALVTALITAFLTEFFTRVLHLQEDASIGLIFSILFATGIVLLTFFSRNLHVGTELVMGNVDALQRDELINVIFVFILNAILFLVFYLPFKTTTFDPSFAKLAGFSPPFFNYLLMAQTAFTAVGAFKAVGVLMVLAFLVLPPLTARLMTHHLHRLLWIAMGVAGGVSFLGVALSRHYLTYLGVGLSTSGLVVLLLGLFYVIVAFFRTLLDKGFFGRYTLLGLSRRIHEKNRSTR